MGRTKESESSVCTSGTERSAGAANVPARDESRIQRVRSRTSQRGILPLGGSQPRKVTLLGFVVTEFKTNSFFHLGSWALSKSNIDGHQDQRLNTT